MCGMRASASLLLSCWPSAHAMNWEGHDDWMATWTRRRYEAPRMPAPAEPACPVSEEAQDNPYEQIPLTGTTARRALKAEPQR